MRSYPLLLMIMPWLLCACSHPASHGDKDALAKVKPEPITRLDAAMVNGRAIDTADIGLKLWHKVMAPNMGMAEWIKGFPSSPVMQIFGRDAATLVPSLDTAQRALGVARQRIDTLLPEVRWRPLYAVVTPYNQSVIVADSVVLISLSRYLGSDYPGYEGFPQYQVRNMTPSRIPIDVIEAFIRTSYPTSPSINTLGRLIYEGAVTVALQRLLPGIDIATALGLSQEEITQIEGNEPELWRQLVASQKLFTTSSVEIAQMFNPAPYYNLSGKQWPGRTPIVIGCHIVEQYLTNNPKAKLSDLLIPKFHENQAQKILKLSGYSGQKNHE